MKAIKKIMSMLLVLTMTMCLAVTAFAAAPLEKGTLTVTGAQLKGKDVTAVRMFTANVDDKNSNNMIDEGDLVSYELEPAWKGFFNEQLGKGHGEVATSAEAYDYVAAMNGNETELVDFAKAAKTYYNAHVADFADLTKKQTADTNNTATFTNLTTGYYLVLPANGSTNANRTTDAMIVNVPGAKAANLELKTEYPSVDKTVTPEGGHGNSVQIGDKVNFELKSKVPNMADYNTYYFAFKDTMSKGLTLDVDSIKVTIGGQEVTKDTDYTVTTNTSGTGETLLAITFDDLKKVAKKVAATAGTEIKIEYSATLNEHAKIGTNPNPNKVELEYSNDPNNDSHGTSEPSITNTYSFEVNIHKYANADEGTLLPGAEFQLQTSPDGTPIKLVKVSSTEYRVATQQEIDADGDTLVDTFLTVDAGEIVIKGLKAGSYQLVEITPPVGYNKLTKPVAIEIQAEYTADGALQPGYPKYIVNKAAAVESNVIKVQNKNGAFLPETGSIGTIGLTLAGVALVVGGVGFTSRKKKEQE